MPDYLKNLTLIGRFSAAGVGPSIVSFAGRDTNKDAFFRNVKPTVTREIVVTDIGFRKGIRYYRLRPPYAIPDKAVRDQVQINLTESDVDALATHGGEDSPAAYAKRGGELFRDLVGHLSTLCLYSHGNFTNAVLAVGSAWVEKFGGLSNALWVKAMESQNLADAIVAYLTCTTKDEADERASKLAGIAQAAGLEGAASRTFAECLAVCRSKLHGPELTDELKKVIGSNGAKLESEAGTFKDYAPFGRSASQREKFWDAFVEYRSARSHVDGFVRNIPAHAYVMLFLFGKYSEGELPPTATELAESKHLSRLFEIGFEKQSERRWGLPVGSTSATVRESCRQGWKTTTAPTDLSDEEQLRLRNGEQEILQVVAKVSIPREETTRAQFLREAEYEHARTIQRSLKDSAIAFAAEVAFCFEECLNQCRGALQTGLDAESQKNRVQQAISNARFSGKKDNEEAFARVKTALVAALPSAAELSYDWIVGKLTACIKMAAAAKIKSDPKGTQLATQARAGYSIQLRNRIDAKGSSQAGAPGCALSVDATSVARRELLESKPAEAQANAAAEPAVAKQEQAIPQRLQKFRQSALSNLATARSATVVATVNNRTFNSSADFPGQTIVGARGGMVRAIPDKVGGLVLQASPTELDHTEIQNQVKLASLHPTGRIVDRDSGVEVGSYVRQESGDGVCVVPTFHNPQAPPKADRLLYVSGCVSVPNTSSVENMPVRYVFNFEVLQKINRGKLIVKFPDEVWFDATFPGAEENIKAIDSSGQRSLVSVDRGKRTLEIDEAAGEPVSFVVKMGEEERIIPFGDIADNGQLQIAELEYPADEKLREISAEFCDAVSCQSVQFELAMAGEPPTHDRRRRSIRFDPPLVAGQELRAKGAITFSVAELNLPTQGKDKEIEIRLPNSDDLLGEVDWSKFSYDIVDSESRMAEEFFGANNDPDDYWPCFTRARKFREHVVASPPQSIPFDEVDLGLTLEAVARMLRVFGRRDDNFRPGKSSDDLRLEQIDLSHCFPIADKAELIDIVKQYELICQEDRSLDGFRREVREALALVESFRLPAATNRDLKLTFMNQTLPELVARLPRRKSKSPFNENPTGYVHVFAQSGRATSAMVDSLLVHFQSVVDAQEVADIKGFRIPVVATDDGSIQSDSPLFVSAVTCQTWIVGSEVSEVYDLPSIRPEAALSPPLSLFAALVLGPAFDDGRHWSDQPDLIPDSAGFGDGLLRLIAAPWDDTARGSLINPGLWTKLAHQRVLNMAFEKWCTAPVAGAAFSDNISPSFANAKIDQVLYKGGFGTLPAPRSTPPVIDRQKNPAIDVLDGAGNVVDKNVTVSLYAPLQFRKS